MSDKSLKVTDRRMFTPDGELREGYRDLDESGSGAEPTDESHPRAPSSEAASSPSGAAALDTAALDAAALDAVQPDPADLGDRRPHSLTDHPVDPEPAPQDTDGPSFFDLVGLLAEPATMYLREAHNADPQTAVQSLELARLHIELLTVLQAKTEGNLSQPEIAMLEDVVYQLRSGYVGLRS